MSKRAGGGGSGRAANTIIELPDRPGVVAPCPAVVQSSRDRRAPTYLEVCCRVARSVGCNEDRVRLAYSRELERMGRADKHFGATVKKAVNMMRGMRSLGEMVSQSTTVTPATAAIPVAPAPQRPRLCPRALNLDDVERRKVIGWFNSRQRRVDNSGCALIIRTFAELGVDTSKWVAWRWRDSQGASAGLRRLEIVCATFEQRCETLRSLRSLAEQPLQMTFTGGRTYSERQNARDDVQWACALRERVQGRRTRTITQDVAPRQAAAENPYAPLAERTEDPLVSQVAGTAVARTRCLRIVTWNANGLRRKVTPELYQALRGVEIFGVTETLCTEIDMVRINGYHHHGIHSGRRTLGGAKPSRGVSIYWRTDLQMDVRTVEHRQNDPDLVWIVLKPRQGRPIFVGCFYSLQSDDPCRAQSYEALEARVLEFQARGDVIVMGDFNARTGLTERNHDAAVNANGRRLVGMIERCVLEFLDLPLGTSPYTRIQGASRSVIDYILVSSNLAERQGTKRVPMTVDCGSDHVFVAADIDIPVVSRRERRDGIVTRINYSALRDGPRNEDGSPCTHEQLAQLRNEYADRLFERLSAWQCDWNQRLASAMPTREDLNDALKEFAEGIKEVSREVLGERTSRRKKAFRWWTPELTQLVRERREAYARLLEAEQPSEALWKAYSECRAKAKAAIDKAREKGWQSLMEALTKAKSALSKKSMWTLIKSTMKRDPSGADARYIRGDQGAVATSTGEALEAWRAHFQQIANPAAPNTFDEEHRVEVERDVNAVEVEDEQLLLDLEDVNEALRAIAVSSAPGPDGIGNIVLKYGGGHRKTPKELDDDDEEGDEEAAAAAARSAKFSSLLLTLFQLCLKAGGVPDQWKEAWQVPIPKRSAEKDPGDRNNFRGITMQSATGKLFCRALCSKHLVNHYEATMCDEQGGFRRNRRCAHQHFLLVDTMQRAISSKRPLYLVFVDIQKAYPSVWRDGLFYKLKRANPRISRRLISLLKECIVGGETKVLIAGETSAAYTSSVGLREGAVESPTLFNYFINDLVQDMRAAGCHGVRYAADWMAALFADDIVIASDDPVDMQKCLDTLHRFCRKWRLTVSMPKTNVMCVGTATDTQFHIGGAQLEKVSEYQYLGIWVASDGLWNVEFNRRLARVREVEARFRHFFAEKSVPMRLRWQAWCAMIRSRIEYGCEMVVLDADKMKILEDMQLDAARRIIGCNRHTAKDAIYGELQIQPLGVRFDKFRVRLVQEIVREGSSLPLHKSMWALGGRGFAYHSFRRAIQRLNSEVPVLNHPVFLQEGPVGWQWAKKRIMAHWISEWRASMNQKVERALHKGSSAQVERYRSLKQMWGNVPYTALPESAFTRFLFKIRSGTLPVLGFEGKRGGRVSAQCKCCSVGCDETISHFLFECEGPSGCNGRARCMMLREVRGVLSRYGIPESLSENLVWKLVLGTPIEEVAPRSFDWRPVGSVPYAEGQPFELYFELKRKSDRKAKKINGRIGNIAQEYLFRMWRDRCSHVDSALAPTQAHDPVNFVNVANSTFVPQPISISNNADPRVPAVSVRRQSVLSDFFVRVTRPTNNSQSDLQLVHGAESQVAMPSASPA
mgnify:FL=1